MKVKDIVLEVFSLSVNLFLAHNSQEINMYHFILKHGS